MPLLNPETAIAIPERARKVRAANRTGCVEFDPADGPRFLHARPDGGIDRSGAPRFQPSESVPSGLNTTDIPEVSDEDLVERFKAEVPRNLAAFEELVRRHEARVMNTCAAMINNRSDAEEVCQDVFLQVFRKIHQFEGRSTFKTWLFRITYNMCLTRRSSLARRRDREALFAKEVDVCKSADLADAGIGDLSDSIQEALGRLDEQKRRIVALKFVSGLSLQEIAEQLNLKLSATKMRFYRALDEFKIAYLDVTGRDLAA